MSFVAAAVGVSAVGSVATGIMGYNAATNASNAQSNAAANALAFQKQVYENNQKTLSPFINAGSDATGSMTRLNHGDFSQFTQSPDYQFALQQGNRGVTNYENAQGMGMSGGALKDISQFNQGLATQNYGNYYNRLMQLGQMGSGAAGSLAGNNTAMGNTVGNTTMAQGQAQASGFIGQANAVNGSISNFGNNALVASALYNKGSNPSAYSQTEPGQPQPATGVGQYT